MTKVSEFTNGAPAQMTDILGAARGGGNVRLTVADILAAAGSAFSKINATAAPTANDDSANTSGNGTFSIGSIWIDVTGDEAYRCVDATPTAAVWVKTTLDAVEAAGLFVSKTGATMSGLLDFSGTNHAGVKLLSLTTAQINALTPAVGMVVVDSDLGVYKRYDGSQWVVIGLLFSNLGNLGSTETLSMANGAAQRGTLDASTEITLPSVNTSGEGWTLDLEVVQDLTGGRLPTFLAASGDTLTWDYGVAPSTNNLHTQPTQANRFRFVAGLDTIRATFLNPKDSSVIQTGGRFIQVNHQSYIGDPATVVTRGPQTMVEAELSTSDATETTLLSVSVPLNTAVVIEGTVLCSKVAGTSGEAFGAGVLQTFHRGTNGNVAEVFTGGEDVRGQAHSSFPAAPAVFDVDTTNQLARLRAIGIAATNLRWMFYGKVTIQNAPAS